LAEIGSILLVNGPSQNITLNLSKPLICKDFKQKIMGITHRVDHLQPYNFGIPFGHFFIYSFFFIDYLPSNPEMVLSL
jgi:hypothetical protein